MQYVNNTKKYIKCFIKNILKQYLVFKKFFQNVHLEKGGGGVVLYSGQYDI